MRPAVLLIRRFGPFGLVALATLAVAAELVLAFGGGGRFALISLHDYIKPLILGVVALSTLLAIMFDRPAWRRTAMVLFAVLGVCAVINFGRYSPTVITDSDLAVGEV